MTFEGKLIDMDKEAERLFEVQIDGVKGKDILTFLPHIEIPQEPEALEVSSYFTLYKSMTWTIIFFSRLAS